MAMPEGTGVVIAFIIIVLAVIVGMYAFTVWASESAEKTKATQAAKH